jgi:exodeoxyribonuclease VIII
MLKILRDKTPLHLKCMMDRKEDPEATDSQIFGSLFHSWVLEPEKVESTFYVRPTVLDGEPWHGNRKVCKQWVTDHGDRQIVTLDQIEHVKGMSEGLRRNKRFMELFECGESEVSLAALEPNSAMMLRGRLDRFHRTTPYILDLKSCVSAHPDEFGKTLWNFGYFAQAFFYIWLRQLCGYETDTFHFVAVEKTPPYANKIYTLRIGSPWLDAGALMVKRDLALYAHCVLNDYWPGYDQEETEPLMPRWAANELAEIGVA